MSDERIDESKLLPCPYCGAGETYVEYKTTSPRMNNPNKDLAVVLRHWCVPGSAPLRTEIRGPDASSVLAVWQGRV